ncbi:glycoside hydrolase family 43 protein [Tenggerimyces flavus]|uniref:Glycoside hydrolase family 43 protein n=1 Tax=Tenggerimyces flavus TaxID=1708749 RepID=A0ABV7YKY4_9ACTN|nr:glycoside hydrolase family 43 protein [Tenggerimyces flavus]MBM7784166.1 beta-xylosidase [Tenggerimyces flavus]
MGVVYEGNFPDPFVLRIEDERVGEGAHYYAYATNGTLGNVQLLASEDLSTWREVGDAMPALASWVIPGRTWAPEVLPWPDGRYAMYYTAHCRATDRQAVGVALADSPEGPFVDDTDGPLLDQDNGGSIDASPFVDGDGTTYLLWKNDGNAIGVDTWIYLQQLAGPRSLVGKVVELIKQDVPWEGNLVEGPFLWPRDGRYYLFYSANAFDRPEYGEGYAVADSPLGPFIKAAENPILAGGTEVAGPGHASMTTLEGRTWLAYHAWQPGKVKEPPGRQFWIDEVVWEDGRPTVARE